ncbi:MAG: hypothetical protein AAGD47_02505 [Pseudomonadota bacterium]
MPNEAGIVDGARIAPRSMTATGAAGYAAQCIRGDLTCAPTRRLSVACLGGVGACVLVVILQPLLDLGVRARATMGREGVDRAGLASDRLPSAA